MSGASEPSDRRPADGEPVEASEAAQAADPVVPHGPGEDGYEVRLADKAARDRSAIEHGRRIGGTVGAAMAGAMIAIRDVVEPAKDNQIVAVSETPDEPHDVDRDGVRLSSDEVGGDLDVAVAPLAPRRLVEGRRRSRRR